MNVDDVDVVDEELTQLLAYVRRYGKASGEADSEAVDRYTFIDFARDPWPTLFGWRCRDDLGGHAGV